VTGSPLAMAAGVLAATVGGLLADWLVVPRIRRAVLRRRYRRWARDLAGLSPS
jgi:hypothetical protein